MKKRKYVKQSNYYGYISLENLYIQKTFLEKIIAFFKQLIAEIKNDIDCFTHTLNRFLDRGL